MRGNLRVGSVVMLCLSFGLVSCSDDSTPQPAGGFKLGFISSFAGTQEASGKSRKNSAEMAIAEINAAGGVLGQQITLSVKDTQTNNDNAIAMAKEAIAEGVIAIVGPTNSGESTAVVGANVIQPAGIVVIAPSATSPALTGIAKSNYWHAAPSDAFQGKIAADYAFKTMAKKTVGIIYVDNAYGQGLEKTFEAAFKDAGGTVAAVVKYPQLSDADLLAKSFDTEAQTLIKDKPELIYMISYPKDGAKITLAIKPLLTAGYKPALLGADAIKSTDFVKNADAELVTGMFGTAGSPPDTDANYKAFKDAYKTKYGIDAATYAEHTYDCVYLIAYALTKGGKIDRASVAPNMKAVSGPPGTAININQFKAGSDALKAGTDIDYQGASGKLDFDDNNDVQSATFVIWTVQTGASGLEIVTKSSVAVENGKIVGQ